MHQIVNRKSKIVNPNIRCITLGREVRWVRTIEQSDIHMECVSVILPAAGSGQRFGAEANKIFQPLCGRAIFLRTIDLFASRGDVSQIMLAIAPADRAVLVEKFGAELDGLGVELVDGGEVRSDSVRNALDRLADGAELVCVHDAVRPCVEAAWIDAVFRAAARSGAAILGCRVHGTLKSVEPSGEILSTIDREGIWEAQTPQVFARDLLLAAYAAGGTATDDAEMVQRIGRGVTVVPGGPTNIKITTPADLALAEAVIRSTG